MKKIIITNTDNENVEITNSDLQIFKDVIMFDGNLAKCEIYDNGWFYLESAIEEIEGKKIEEIEKSGKVDEVLENYFENHLFANEFHGV